jgi:hypothetical protein
MMGYNDMRLMHTRILKKFQKEGYARVNEDSLEPKVIKKEYFKK